MQKTLLCLAITCLSHTAIAGDHAVDWSYSGATGPQHWGELTPDFNTCNTGKNQSPINLTDFMESDLPDIQFHYQPGGYEMVNNGHTLQVNYSEGSQITLNNHTYTLKQFHFHSPSENKINGKSYPMEAHFVHADKDGNLAVVAVMFETGAPHRELSHIWARIPRHIDTTKHFPVAINAQALLPSSKDYYRFNGSLTTPPCTEGVTWLVMKAPITVSRSQVKRFTYTIKHANNRPLQATNARIIAQ